RVLIEVGAAPALMAAASRAAGFGEAPVLVPTLRRNRPASQTLGNVLAHLFVSGVDVRWDKIYAPSERIAAPGYPFADQRHWVPLQQSVAMAPSAAPVAVDAALASAPAVTAGHATGVQLQSPQEQRLQIAEALASSLQLASADADSDRGFLQQGVDSLELTEAVATLERRWTGAVPRRAWFENLGSPKRLLDYIVQNLAQAPAVQATAAAVSPTVVAGAGTLPRSALPAAPLAALGDLQALASFSRAYVDRSRGSQAQRREY